MAYIGPYQQYMIDGDATVARVSDWEKQATAINAGLAQAEKAARWEKGTLGKAANLSTLKTPGKYNAESSSVVSSIVDKPAAATTNPFEINVSLISAANDVHLQQFIQWHTNGPKVWERVSLGGTFPAWTERSAPQDARLAILEGAAMTTATDLNTLTTPGKWFAPTSTIAQSILNRPYGWPNPFSVETEILSSTNGIILQRATALNLVDGRWVIEPRHRYRLGGAFSAWIDPTAEEWTRQDSVYCFGDSLTQNGFPTTLGQHLSVPVVNRGKSGDTSNDVLLRSGAIVLHGTPTGGTIPTSGAVAVNLYGQRLTTRDNRAFAVTWAGVPGTLLHTTGEAWTFTRTTSGSAVAVSQPAPLVSAEQVRYGGTFVYLFGTNDAWVGGYAPDTDLTTHIKANYARVVDSVSVDPIRHAIVLGMVTARSTVVGDALHKLVQEVNGYCQASHPHLFVPLQNYLSTKALADMGLTPTTADSAATAAGLIPPTLYTDDLHFTPQAQAAIAQHLIAPALKSRGWA